MVHQRIDHNLFLQRENGATCGEDEDCDSGRCSWGFKCEDKVRIEKCYNDCIIASLHHVIQCIDTPILLITPLPYSLTMAQSVRRTQIVRDGVVVVRLV